MIRTRDHAPAHVHIFRAGTEVIINLGVDGKPAIRDINGMSRQNVVRALAITVQNNKMFLRRWREIYG
ncbi:MAG: DUF4160 domain-containing protein [Pyrinomonadaceae bacterium]